MKILIFEQRYTGIKEAGIGRYGLFAKEWARSGNQIYVISGMINYVSGKKPEKYRRRIFVKEKESENVIILRVFEFSLGYLSFFGRLLSYFSFLISAFFGALFLPRPDIIIASSPPIFIGVLGYLTGILKRSIFVFEVRDMWPDEAIELGFLKNKLLIKMSLWLERFLYKRAKFIITNSPGIREFLTAKKSLSKGKIAVIPNPVQLDLFLNKINLATKEDLGWQDKFLILYTGAHSAVYDFDSVLETAKELKDLPILFVLMGSGRQKKSVVKKAEEIGLKNIRFLDAVSKEKLADFIKMADACIVPLRNMGLLKHVYATKIFDYMAGAKPVIVAADGVSSDLVCKEAGCGLCVEPENKNSFREALLDIYNNPAKGKKMGQKGFEYLKENYNCERLAENYFSVLTAISRTNNRTKATK